MRLAGLILAGGGGRRMGGKDKALLPLAGRALLDHVTARFGPQVDRLALSANGDPARFAGFGLPVLADQSAGAGPLAGVLAGLDWAAEADALVTAAVDTPFLPHDLAARLVAASGGGAWPVLAETPAGLHPTFALWPLALRDPLRKALTNGQRKLRDAAFDLGAHRAIFGREEVFFNINTAQDLVRADAILAAGAG